MIKAWSEFVWEDYLWWQAHDRKMLGRINQLIRDIERDPFSGSGLWSRRIDHTNRLVYEVSGDTLMLYSAKDRYE